MIRPARDAREIIEEGQFLHHCVGRGDYYISKHNGGTSYILFVRFSSNPNEPYITLEVDGETDKIIQWYGRNDSKPEKETMDSWLEEWKKEVAERKEKLKEAAAYAAAPAAESVESGQILVAAG